MPILICSSKNLILSEIYCHLFQIIFETKSREMLVNNEVRSREITI